MAEFQILERDRIATERYAWHTSWCNRVLYAQRLRRDPPRRATPSWVAIELLYHATALNADLADAVLVVTVEGGLGGLAHARAVTPSVGRRIVRLRYDWDVEIVPHLGLRPRQLSAEVLAPMGAPGGVLRAMVREARDR